MGSGLEDRFQNLHEIVKAARGCLPQGPWGYLVGGAETETTVRRNRQALDSIAFRPRVLRNVANVDLTTTFLGRTVLSFTGDLSSPGGRTAPGRVTATCEDALVYGPPPEGMPDMEAALSLSGSAHVVSLSEGDERPQTIDADWVRLLLKRRPPPQAPGGPGGAAAGASRAPAKAVAFDARGRVRLDGPRFIAAAETMRGERMDRPDYQIVAEGRGASGLPRRSSPRAASAPGCPAAAGPSR